MIHQNFQTVPAGDVLNLILAMTHRNRDAAAYLSILESSYSFER
jgi:hypothetical protein